MLHTSKQLAISGYQNITFDGTILILFNTNITCDCIFVTFDGSLLFFSYSMVSFLYCAVPTSHVTVFFHIWWFSLFFFSHLMVPSSHCAVLTSHVTVLLSHLVVPLFFFLTFDDIILTLCSTNIICDYTFVTFGGSLIFSHLMVPSSHYAIPTSHVIVLFSHSVVSLLFAHI